MAEIMNPFENFVQEHVRLLEQGRAFPLGQYEPTTQPDIPESAPRVLLFSPHPDDEVIVGGLPLRMLREMRWRVINVAVTQGSNKARQQARWQELVACCRHIGFEPVQTRPNGLEDIKPKTRTEKPQVWAEAVECIARILADHQPRVIFFPHERDWNSTHIGTHYLVADALSRLGQDFGCFTVETEYWGPMDDPNLMIESSPRDLIDLLTALSFHVGEVQRNPYHLRMPAWMIDNVRRGAELVGGQGGAAPPFIFATLYRMRRWHQGRFESFLQGGRFVGQGDSLATLFEN